MSQAGAGGTFFKYRRSFGVQASVDIVAHPRRTKGLNCGSRLAAQPVLPANGRSALIRTMPRAPASAERINSQIFWALLAGSLTVTLWQAALMSVSARIQWT